ncbi:MAG: hypothetical protein A3C55_05475 [Gammaproteobacteria bacterium RIFCSPHIGHO2_02_FULL_42_13]|nr:MAG: hypothetical protein A3C55_05475 [Gammaproteobacteria bacterium RIFCSPHIGHO2_02_FULL_42_13]OGT69555.1 MAG: hypothetical protein A3H43_01200 [Gammaproteobacteria bacterium RIFCSPLOWO2_02_FULL_42_9]
MKTRLSKLILIMGCALLANTALASGSSSVTYPQSQDTIQQNQNLAKAQQAIDQSQVDTNKLQQQLQQKLQPTRAGDTATQPPSTTTPAAATTQKTTPTPSTSTTQTCDCYTTTDPYNYSGNFLYDNSGKRVSRVYPSCQCNPQAQNTVPTVTSTSIIDSQTRQNTQTSTSPVVMPNSNSQTGNQQGSSGSGWNIQY